MNNFLKLVSQTIRRIPKLMLIPYYAYRFFQPKYSVGVVGIVFNANNEVLLVEHVFHPKLPWGLPGGWIGFNEDPEQTAQRELREELGLTVKVDSLILLKRTQFNHIDIAYLCLAENEVGTLSYELLNVRWFKMQDLPRLHSFHYDAIRIAYEKVSKELV